MNLNDRYAARKERSELASQAVDDLLTEWRLERQAVPEPTDAEWQKIKRRDNCFLFFKVVERHDKTKWLVALDQREPVWIYRDNFEVLQDHGRFFIVKVSGYCTHRNTLLQAESPRLPETGFTDEERDLWRKLSSKRWEIDRLWMIPASRRPRKSNLTLTQAMTR